MILYNNNNAWDTHIHTYIQNNNTFSSIGRNAETLALQQWFWHLCYFSDLSKKLVSENLTLRIFSNFFSTWVQMSYWWKNKDVCMYGWMVSIQIMLFQSRLWLLGLWLLRRWLVRRCFRGTWLLRTWFVGTWLLWTWLLRSYLEPGYTEHNHFVVFSMVISGHLDFFRLFFSTLFFFIFFSLFFFSCANIFW